MTDDKAQLCGAIDEPDYGVWFECELPPGHADDHQAVHYWENQPHGPMPAPRHGAAPSSWLWDVQTQMQTQLIGMAMQGSPLVRRDKVLPVQTQGMLFAPIKLDGTAMADLIADQGFEVPSG